MREEAAYPIQEGAIIHGGGKDPGHGGRGRGRGGSRAGGGGSQAGAGNRELYPHVQESVPVEGQDL